MPSGIYLRTKEAKMNMSKAKKGKPITLIHRKHISEALKSSSYVRCKPSEEVRRKMSLSAMGNTSHLGHKHSEETKAQMSKNKKGLPSKSKGKHWKIKDTSKMKGRFGVRTWNYIQDRTKLAILSNGEEYRNSSASREWGLQVKNRDKWSCRIADINCDGKMVAHHILPWRDFPELRYEVNNGITLCHFHHPRKRNDEIKFIPTFQELVGVKVQ